MNVLGQYLTRLFYTSVFKVLSTQEDKDIKNHHAEYPTLHLMTRACVCMPYPSITLSAFAFLYVLPRKTCPTLCDRLKQLGKVAAPLNCAPGGDLRKGTASFRRLLMLLLLKGRQGKTLGDEKLPCSGKVPGLCTKMKTVSWDKVSQWVLFNKHA